MSRLACSIGIVPKGGCGGDGPSVDAAMFDDGTVDAAIVDEASADAPGGDSPNKTNAAATASADAPPTAAI